MKDYVLWGIKPNTAYEDYIGTYTNKTALEQAKADATAQGCTQLRVMIYAGEQPDFIRAIRI